jgi:hypothetical protein
MAPKPHLKFLATRWVVAKTLVNSLLKQENPVSPKTEIQKAPQPSVDRVEELAARILSGDIILPKFQREFVWSKKQVIELWDSIARNYPMGSVLLWRSRETLKAERTIADLEIGATQYDYPVNYLLDGQQRLSSVCGALYWKGEDPDSQWNIAYDLRTSKFFHMDTLDSPPNHQVRLNWLSDPALFFSQLARVSTETDGANLREAGNELFNRLKDYKIATVTLLEMSIEDVGPIFERINSRGTPLTIVDLMRAATWSDKFDLFDQIDKLRTEIEAKGFGNLDRKIVLRSLSSAAGGGYSEGSIDNLRGYEADHLIMASDATREAFKRAVDFLATELSIPADENIPYTNQLVVLSDVFRLLPNPSSPQRVALRHWFWRAAVTGYFGGWNTGNMAADQQAVAAFAAGQAVDIEIPVTDTGAGIWTTQQFRLNTAHAKILTLLLAFNQPVDLLTGQKIDIDKALHYANSKEYHHFFPRNFLSGRGVPNRKANLLANFVMLTAHSNKMISNRAPSDYLKDVEAALGSDLKKALTANLISDAAYSAAKRDDYDTFLVERAKTIYQRSKDLTGW